MLCFNSSLSLTLWSCYTRIECAEQAHLSVMAPCPFHSPICGVDPLMTWGCQKVCIGRSAVTGVWLQKELRLYFMNELSLFSVDFYRFHSWALMSHNHCFDFVKPEGRCILFVDPPGYKWRGGKPFLGVKLKVCYAHSWGRLALLNGSLSRCLWFLSFLQERERGISQLHSLLLGV